VDLFALAIPKTQIGSKIDDEDKFLASGVRRDLITCLRWIGFLSR
jgi:hypothetical protein